MRTAVLVSSAILFAGGLASAQFDASSRLRPITGPIRNGGTYHLATHTWTRATSQANLVGTSTIYNNTCPSGYFSDLSGFTYVDEGRIPSNSANEPSDTQNRPGCATQYQINGFQIAYCTDQPMYTFGTYSIAFFEAYSPCTTTIGMTPTASFALQGLPASNVLGTMSCWIVNIDLDAPPRSTSLAFAMQADGDGTYTGPVPSYDLFGWSMSTTALGTGTGPIIAGNFNTCTGYDGTRWSPTVDYAAAGTGMSTMDLFRIDTNMPGGCAHFGGDPFASFHLRLFSSAPCITNEPGAAFCFGDGAFPHVPCPCNNSSVSTDQVGCLDSFGIGGKLRASGAASVSNDTLTLLGSQMPPTSTCLYFQGTLELHDGNGAQFGDGLRCAGGTVTRLGVKGNVAGASHYPSAGDPSISVHGAAVAGQARTYQVWYRNIASFCTSATFNLTNGYHVVWQP